MLPATTSYYFYCLKYTMEPMLSLPWDGDAATAASAAPSVASEQDAPFRSAAVGAIRSMRVGGASIALDDLGPMIGSCAGRLCDNKQVAESAEISTFRAVPLFAPTSVLAVNSDGTLSRISNWHRLSEHEQEVAIKRLAKRNAARLAELQSSHSGGASTGASAPSVASSDAPACGGAGSGGAEAAAAGAVEPVAPGACAGAAMTLDGGGGVRIGLRPDAAAAVAAAAAEKTARGELAAAAADAAAAAPEP